jgi:methylmalonyl-CoA mutase
MTMPTESFLSEFPLVTTSEWEAAIHRDLKGADYASKLIWHAEEGIDVKPYYRAEDLHGRTFPDATPLLLGLGVSSNASWRIREEIDLLDPEEANRAAREAVAAGAEEIVFVRAVVSSPSDLALLLVNLSEVPIHFGMVDAHAIHLIVDRLYRHAVTLPAALSAGLDPFADLDESAAILANRPASLVPFVLHAEQLLESGATSAEELGLTIAAAVDLLAEMQQRGLDPDNVAGSLTFSFAIGPHILIQIAKLRAFRLLWAQALRAFGVAPEHARARIHARTARWNRTGQDPHVNILRATTESVSAILGGADSLSVAPFDEYCAEPNEASRRLARNTQLILKHEALFDRVADPGAGSYCLEVLTDSIARNAWEILQRIEAGGGYLRSSPTIQSSVTHSSCNSRP